MSRRAGREEIAAGSDSFLDIVANIVGILIILIVVAGVRVSSAPVPAPEAETPESPVVQVEPQPEPTEPPPEPEPVSAPVHEPSPELVQRAQDLEAELARLETKASTFTANLGEAEAVEEEVAQRLKRASQTLKAQTEDLEKQERRLAGLRDALEETRSKLRAARSRLETVEREKSPAKQIQHKLTPVSRVVEGKELHFRLKNDRVAHVPVDELVERLRSQITRQKDWLTRFRRHQGQVGPVDGFSMHYIVERQQLSVVEELRHGSGMMRIGVSEWQIKPEPELATESAREALRSGSAFVRHLRMADPDATLTFWVYPDSFALYRELQHVAHAEGFTVAARPLPFGVPIAGSPHGSRSAGQ